MMREKSWKRRKKRRIETRKSRLERKRKPKQDSELKKTRIGIPGLY
jgi:hypothetical protein